MTDDKRLIEDYLPIRSIAREGTTSKGHINTLHLWWARRPLVACRAATYAALVPVSEFMPNGGSDSTKKALGRANAAKFLKELAKYPAIPSVVERAHQHIWRAHASRLSEELGTTITIDDVVAGKYPRPRVLDMFAGGGAIPLEALRLGCDAFANDLNPVAHIIELCTLSFPQRFGRPDPTVRGATGPESTTGEATWGELADEVRHWGTRILAKVKASIGDLYPPIPDPSLKGENEAAQGDWIDEQEHNIVHPDSLIPVAYLWTRTVRCKNHTCGAQVPLLRQTWMCKRGARFVALRASLHHESKAIRYEVVESTTEDGLGFDPSAGSVSGGSSTCLFCKTVADSDYVKSVGRETGFGVLPLAAMCLRKSRPGKVYVPFAIPSDFGEKVAGRLADLVARTGLTPPDEPLEANPRSFDVQRYGFVRWRQAFTERQNLMLLSFAAELRSACTEMKELYKDSERCKALYTCVALTFSRLVTQHNSFAFIHTGRETIEGPWGDGKFPMSWDFAEANPFSGATASYASALNWASRVYENVGRGNTPPATVSRSSAMQLDLADSSFDAVITDPPYYDSVSYSNLADAYYVWLKRSLAHIFPEHFASPLSPKRPEAIKASYRHKGNNSAASKYYEEAMTASFQKANSLLKPGGAIVVVYAHKTTLGWSTLVDALRSSRFTITEAWPLATEATGGRKKKDKAMLASSIFLVARKRDGARTGGYETEVRPELEAVVRERVETLWEMGISGADLVIACVGAGLRAFTKFARVEYDNGEEVAAQRFLAEVETVVLETILSKLSKTVGGKAGQNTLASLDPATRFYILWRYTYGTVELEAGEAIIFANGTHVELEGQHSLTQGNRALLEKKKSKYRLHDYTQRGKENALGQPAEDGTSAPAVDALHRLLWLLEHKPLKISEFLYEAKPNVEQVRLVAQVLGGPALSGGELADVSSTAEQSAIGKLLANWNAVMVSKAAIQDRRTGQEPLFKR